MCAELCKSLCLLKVGPDAPVDIGFTALFTAAQFGLRDTVSVLVELGADPHRFIWLTHLLQNNNYFVSGNVQSYLHQRLIIKTTNKQLKLKISSRHKPRENKDWTMLLSILGEKLRYQKCLSKE